MMGGPGGFNRPVEEGKEYDVTIDAQGSKGDGIAHLEGFVIFVAGAQVGQTVKVKITSIRRTFAIGEIIH
jgi:predicted RNA-binding protein with TRAM domain